MDFQRQNETGFDLRTQAVLSAIIKEHLITGEAVGSRVLSERFANAAGLSAATIRNLMGELEAAELVEQPHTSAGRIPTDKGYRFYVDHILQNAKLSRADRQAIEALLLIPSDGARDEPDRLMERTSHVLSALTENVGIVVWPSLAENRLQHIEFLQLADKRVLVILVSTANIVRNRIIHVDEQLSQDELERTSRYLNANFRGKTLIDIRAEILELMQEEKALYDKLLRNAILLCEGSLGDDEATTGDVYVDGASNMLAKPDFADVERMRELFRTFEEKSRLVKILNECVARQQMFPGGVKVAIGREHAAPSMRDCALITAPYRIGAGETTGTLGVVGPMRIEYARLMAVVNYLARVVERTLAQETASH
jgi:heat-inducible transcriptional repressor